MMTELRVTDPELVTWFKQYAAARDEKLETIVNEALAEYREAMLRMAGFKPEKIDPVIPEPEPLTGGTPNADDLRVANTASLSLPPMVPGPEELF